MELRGKTALVTGGAVRIGRAICEALAGAGCQVVVHYHRSGKEARETTARLRALGVRAFAVRAALRSERDCDRLVAAAWRKAGRLDFLVNSAAVFHKDGLRTATEARLLGELRTNLLAPIALTRACARRWQAAGKKSRGKAGPGKVVNLLDRRIAGNEVGCLPYLLSKKALAEFTRNAALELAPDVTVNAVAPGAVLPPPGKGQDYLRDLAGPIPLARRPTPRDVAEAALFLLRSDAVTGQVLFVDSGQHLVG